MNAIEIPFDFNPAENFANTVGMGVLTVLCPDNGETFAGFVRYQFIAFLDLCQGFGLIEGPPILLAKALAAGTAMLSIPPATLEMTPEMPPGMPDLPPAVLRIFVHGLIGAQLKVNFSQ
jgi:hypothetical protein